MSEGKLIRVGQAAEMLGMSRSSIYRWFWEGRIDGVQIADGPIRIFESSIIKIKTSYMDEQPLPSNLQKALTLILTVIRDIEAGEESRDLVIQSLKEASRLVKKGI